MTQLMVHHDKAEFLVCTLCYGNVLQQALDLNFTEGEEVTFFSEGRGESVLPSVPVATSAGDGQSPEHLVFVTRQVWQILGPDYTESDGRFC